MGKTYELIDANIRQWIEKQQMFFVGTAPLGKSGSVNISPKGLDTFRIIDAQTLAYLDFGGSGVETIAHLRENGRIVIMMCAYEGPPKIYRFHGTGEVLTALDSRFEALAKHFDRSELGIRSIIRVNVTRISDSCGYGVPLYEFQQQRDISPKLIQSTKPEKLKASLKKTNQESIDGLPGVSESEIDSYQSPITRKKI
jgi:predicted pyridoxine 5'-phosphate oxidase superfamily flavin-nucleotide-binding protein